MNMAAATAMAMSELERKVGDIDSWVSLKLDWTMDELKARLTSEQIDSLALAIDSMESGTGMILADTTGFGKGRTLAAAARAAVLAGLKVIFLTEKANLFSDFWRDVKDIGSDALFGRPFLLNDGARIIDTYSPRGDIIFSGHKKRETTDIIRSHELPQGCRIMMSTYSQFNRAGTLKADFLGAVADGAFMILDESHNFVGDSNTRKVVGGVFPGLAASIFSSATFARDLSDLSAYRSVFPWLQGLPDFDELTPGQSRGISEESSLIATRAGRIIRREHDLSNMVLRIHTVDEKQLAFNRSLSDGLAPILARMAHLSRRVDAILAEKNEANKQFVEMLGSSEEKRQERESFMTANFGSRLNAVLSQFLVALNVGACVDMCVETLLRGEKPVVVIEATMEAMMREMMADDDGDSGDDSVLDEFDFHAVSDDDKDGQEGYENNQRSPTFRDALTLLARRLTIVSRRSGPAWTKERITLDDAGLLREQEEIMNLVKDFPDLSLSPIDDIRDRVEARGQELFSRNELEKPWKADEISARSMRVVNGTYEAMPPSDRNRTVARFVSGEVDLLVLTQAASTGLSLHDGEKFTDRRRRHMIELSPPRNVLARIQMWGRVWRRGQMSEPVFSVLDTGLPFHSFDLAARNRKLINLSASVTGTSKATVLLDIPDPLDQVGNDVAHDILHEQREMAEKMSISLNVDKEEADRKLYFVGKFFRRLPLLSSSEQEKACHTFYAAYRDRMRSGADIAHNSELEGKWSAVESVVFEPGDGSENVLTGTDVMITTIQAKVSRNPLRSEAVRDALKKGAANRTASDDFRSHIGQIKAMRNSVLEAALPKKKYRTVRRALQAADDNPVCRAERKLDVMVDLLETIRPGCLSRMPYDDGGVADAIIIDIHPPDLERAHIPREYEITYMVPGDDVPRFISLDSMIRDQRARPTIGVTDLTKELAKFDSCPHGEVLVTRKILDGNGIAAILASRRIGHGRRVTYEGDDGTIRSGVLLPAAIERRLGVLQSRTGSPVVAAAIILAGGRVLTNPEHPADGVEFRPNPAQKTVTVVIPAGKRNAKNIETAEFLELTGEFSGDWRERTASVPESMISSITNCLHGSGMQFYFDARYLDLAVSEQARLNSGCLNSGRPGATNSSLSIHQTR